MLKYVIFLNYFFNLRDPLFHMINKKFSSFLILKKNNSQVAFGLIKWYDFNGKANKSMQKIFFLTILFGLLKQIKEKKHQIFWKRKERVNYV